jgi:hypothetical protein
MTWTAERDNWYAGYSDSSGNSRTSFGTATVPTNARTTGTSTPGRHNIAEIPPLATSSERFSCDSTMIPTPGTAVDLAVTRKKRRSASVLIGNCPARSGVVDQETDSSQRRRIWS